MAAEAEARRQGADDAVFVDADATVLEGPTTNVWWRRERTLFTPSLDLGILAGVTRATVLELAGDCGYAVEEGHFGLTELLAADEAFTSSSVREVMPVTELDGAPIARGPAADELQAALRQAAGATLRGMSDKIRLGGMALSNGVLVHGPTAWACAIRTDEGEIKVASARKRLFAPRHPAAVPARPAPPGGVVRDDPRAAPEAAGGAAAVRAPLGARGHDRERVDRSGRAPLAEARRRRARAALGSALARARDDGAPRRRAGRLPRRRARLDRDVRARREAREGARALRLAPDRPAARGVGRRQPPRRRARRRTCAGRRGPRARSAPSASRSRCSPG